MMPKVIGNDSLIARVNEVQGCMHRQSNELGRLNKAVKRYKEENAKLRELVRHMLMCAANVDFDGSPACQVCPYDRDGDRSACDFGRRAQELGIEVDDG